MAFCIILRNPNGNRYILYLYRNDNGKWNWNYNWLDNDWNTDNPSAVLANPFISPPTILLGGVLFQNLSVPPS